MRVNASGSQGPQSDGKRMQLLCLYSQVIIITMIVESLYQQWRARTMIFILEEVETGTKDGSYKLMASRTIRLFGQRKAPPGCVLFEVE